MVKWLEDGKKSKPLSHTTASMFSQQSTHCMQCVHDFMYVLFTMDQQPSPFFWILSAMEAGPWYDAKQQQHYPHNNTPERKCFKKQSAFYSSLASSICCCYCICVKRLRSRKEKKRRRRTTHTHTRHVIEWKD